MYSWSLPKSVLNLAFPRRLDILVAKGYLSGSCRMYLGYIIKIDDIETYLYYLEYGSLEGYSI